MYGMDVDAYTDRKLRARLSLIRKFPGNYLLKHLPEHSNYCMRVAAEMAAHQSSFNISLSAPQLDPQNLAHYHQNTIYCKAVDSPILRDVRARFKQNIGHIEEELEQL
jgi:hypothetical protein